MNWKAPPPAIEIAAVTTAALCLGGAVAFAIARLAPLGAGLVEAGAVGTAVALAGGMLVGRVDRRSVARVESPAHYLTTGEEPVPGEPAEDVLLLDDPLPVAAEERVVRLFAGQPMPGEAPASLAGPGEMIARIEDFLGHARPARPDPDAAAEDASAALHAALADIRRSLRHG